MSASEKNIVMCLTNTNQVCIGQRKSDKNTDVVFTQTDVFLEI